MTPKRRILLNIVAIYARSLHAIVSGLFISRWVLAAEGKLREGSFGVGPSMSCNNTLSLGVVDA